MNVDGLVLWLVIGTLLGIPRKGILQTQSLTFLRVSQNKLWTGGFLTY